MGGAFQPVDGKPGYREYNIVTDLPAARKLATEWPTPIVWSGFEIGCRAGFRQEALSGTPRFESHGQEHQGSSAPRAVPRVLRLRESDVGRLPEPEFAPQSLLTRLKIPRVSPKFLAPAARVAIEAGRLIY
jgi:hypothetical protein